MANYITRTGIGYDVHKFDTVSNQENFVILGGLKIPHPYNIIAHSDGDVLLHAITDALLGAMALGDIGDHFPPTDEKWRHANSIIFLQHALALVQKKGGTIINIDSIIIAEKPKLMDYKQKIQESIANMLALAVDQISVKATTSEKLGFVGRQEGIAAQAICSIQVKESA